MPCLALPYRAAFILQRVANIVSSKEGVTKMLSIIVALLSSIALTGSLYECYPTEPGPGEMVVCPLEGLETPSGAELDWIAHDPWHDPWMAHNPTTITWQGIHLDGPGPDRARLDEFVHRLFDVLQDEFGRIEPGRVDIESNESLKRLIDELQEETGMKITRVEIERGWGR